MVDFECSSEVVGIWFFRAPEILQAYKDYDINNKPELFMEVDDVYTYGMMCYKILTVKLPFQDHIL